MYAEQVRRGTVRKALERGAPDASAEALVGCLRPHSGHSTLRRGRTDHPAARVLEARNGTKAGAAAQFEECRSLMTVRSLLRRRSDLSGHLNGGKTAKHLPLCHQYWALSHITWTQHSVQISRQESERYFRCAGHVRPPLRPQRTARRRRARKLRLMRPLKLLRPLLNLWL